MKLVKFYPGNGQLRRYDESFNNFSNFWNDYFNDDFGISDSQSPKVNIREEDEKYELEMAIPGIKKKNIQINFEKDILKISHKEIVDNDNKEFNRIEFNYSSFERSFKLSDSVDVSKIKAEMKDGILKITLSKKDEAIENAKREIIIS
ncbi:MAG: Hsp20/alpha crystallin family protein [Bacteroidales bacterium]|nr:Hsp20/alpha crystallin family protein [Bacteroidales bacterium]